MKFTLFAMLSLSRSKGHLSVPLLLPLLSPLSTFSDLLHSAAYYKEECKKLADIRREEVR
jgi:hypothetical protein